MEAFFLTGDIEKYGTGFHRIRTAIKDYPGMKFSYREMQGGFVSEISYEDETGAVGKVDVTDSVTDKVPDKVPDRVPDNLTENQEKIILLLAENNRLSLSKLAEMIGMSKRKMLDNINVLKEKDFIERIGTPKGGYWKILKG